MIRLTIVIADQQDNPIRIGLAPDFTNFTIFVFNPIAAIAIMIINLLKFFRGEKKDDGTPKKLVQMVVIKEAAMNQRMKTGKIFLISTFFSPADSLWVRTNARDSVIGMIASVRVSFTVTALSRVSLPSP